MKLLSFLLRNGSRKIILISALGLVGGLVSAAFVALINATLHNSADRTVLIGLFFFIVAVRLGSNVLAQILLATYVQDATLKLSEDICRRVLKVPFRKIEEIGPAVVLTTLTDDVGQLTSAIAYVPALVSHLTTLIGCSVYLAWISWSAFVLISCITILGGLYYIALQRKALPAIEKARAGRDTLFRHLRSITDGIKELKMNRNRRSSFLKDEIGNTMAYLRRQHLEATTQYLKADAFSQGMFYLAIGFLLFVLPVVQQFTVEDITRYCFIALFSMTPIWGVIGILPAFDRGKTALNRITALELALEKNSAKESREETLNRPSNTTPTIELDQVCFTYGDKAAEAGFHLGPIDLKIAPGDLLFIVGGNGSGKSTLVKLLTGLYAPDSGTIRVDGHVISGDDDDYRQLFSTVFSDFFLFDRLPGPANQERDLAAKKYLETLSLSKVVDIENGVLSTTALSQGQRRRLALLTAYMENRSIYVFDEWAADQDPAYKHVFYSHLLPELKAAGKTVIVITHDDRYFHIGDHVVTVDSGRIVKHSERQAVLGA